jgi:hypothetical protein
MGYTVTTAKDCSLADQWLIDAEHLEGQLSDPDSIRYRRLLALGKPASTASLSEIKKYAEDVRSAVAGTVQAGLTDVDSGIRLLENTGASKPPEDEREDAWLEGFKKFHEGIQKIHGASLPAAGTYARLEDCRTILGQITNAGGTGDLLVLSRCGVPQAIALQRIGNKEVAVADIVVSPNYIVDQGKGAGSALMEYLVREAKARDGHVTLISLDPRVQGDLPEVGLHRAGQRHGAAATQAR